MKFVISFFFIVNTGFAQTDAGENLRRMLKHGGIEYVVHTGNSTEPVDHGIDQFIGKATRVSKYSVGKLVYDVTYTVDKNGFRTGPSSHLKGKKKHFLILDGSIAMGEGLQDNETIHELINKRSKIYEAYALGFFGEGPQHHWMKFKEGKLPSRILEKKGSAIIITHEPDIGKLTGSLQLLSFIQYFPRLIETSPSVFQNSGMFMHSGTIFQKFISKFCSPYIFCSKWLAQIPNSISTKDIAFAARVLDSTEKMYREQFDVENVTIIWLGTEEGRDTLHMYSKNKIFSVVFNAYPDGHPTSKGAEQIVDFLFYNKIIE